MIDECIKIFSAMLTPVLGVIAIYIAWQQWRTNDLKCRHDLYERRLAVYLAVMEFLACIMRKTKATDEETISFLQKTRESYFLFGPEIATYLDKIYKRSLELEYHNTMLNDPTSHLPVGAERTRLAQEKSAALEWCIAQFEIAREKFAAYMSLS